jgi:hypothetical protein
LYKKLVGANVGSFTTLSIKTNIGTSSKYTKNSSNNYSYGNAIRMTIALSVGAKLAPKAAKAATIASFLAEYLGLGESAIVAINKLYASYPFGTHSELYISYDIGKNSLVLFALSNLSIKEVLDDQKSTLIEFLSKVFDLSGNNVLDLLKMIDYFNNLQYIFLYFILYIYILLNVDSSKIELYLSKILPNLIVKYYIKSVNTLKKHG